MQSFTYNYQYSSKPNSSFSCSSALFFWAINVEISLHDYKHVPFRWGH